MGNHDATGWLQTFSARRRVPASIASFSGVKIQHPGQEFSGTRRADELQPDRMLIGLDSQLEAEEAATLAFRVNNLRDPGEKTSFDVEPHAVTIRQIDPLLRFAYESAQEILSPGLECSRAESANNGQIGDRHVSHSHDCCMVGELG